MFPFIYIEREIQDHPRTRDLLLRFSKATPVIIDRWSEVFNRKAQNFRLQKKKPSLILAKKHDNFIHKIPNGYGIGTPDNYYFSHLLNCPYDCRYCFLQGMFYSAHYVFFINLEDFAREIKKSDNSATTFFTGYDCDSLGLESVTHFARTFLPFIQDSQAFFEFRTKSSEIRPFLEREALKNCVLSWTLSPEYVQKEHESRTPSLQSRLFAMQEVQKKGWNVGLRFDPILDIPDGENIYQTFFDKVFQHIQLNRLHSVTLGAFRAPKHIFKKMVSLYPDEPLFARGLSERHQLIISRKSLLSFCQAEVLKYIPQEKFFPCHE